MAKGKHKSVPKELKKHVSWIEAQGAKVVLGLSECARHKFSPGHIRLVARDDAGLKAIGYSGNGIINFFIVCKSPEIADLMLAKFGDNLRPN